MVVVGAIASAIGIALGLWIDWFPVSADKQAKPIDTLYDVLIIVTVPIFVIVTTIILFSVLNFRMRPGQEHQDGPPIHGNTKLEIVWTAIPAIMLVSMCTYAAIVLSDIERKPANAAQPELNVGVLGQQFAWTFTYPKALTGGKQITTTDLYLPEGRSVQFQIRAREVLHSFWVPSFRLKMDAVPGITTRYRVTPNKLGVYPIVCAELCGLGHAVMRSQVHVLTGAQFAAWLKKQGAPATPTGASPEQLAAAGKKIFLGGAGCAGCHTLADAGTTAKIGPNLDGALKGSSLADIRTDIVDPNKTITKGFPKNVMPTNFGQTLSSDDLKALTTYLEQVAAK